MSSKLRLFSDPLFSALDSSPLLTYRGKLSPATKNFDVPVKMNNRSGKRVTVTLRMDSIVESGFLSPVDRDWIWLHRFGSAFWFIIR